LDDYTTVKKNSINRYSREVSKYLSTKAADLGADTTFLPYNQLVVDNL